MEHNQRDNLERSLGPSKALLLLSLAERFGMSFTIEQVRQQFGGNRPRLLKDLHELTESGWLLGLGRGSYMIAPLEAGPNSESYAVNRYLAAATIVGERPYYLSYRTAMELHGMTMHPWRTVYVSTSSRLRSREIQSFEVKPVTVPNERLWGSVKIEVVPDHRVSASSWAKTIVDCLDIPRYAGGIGDVALGMHLLGDKLEPDVAIDNALRLGKVSVIKRLGVLLELVAKPSAGTLDRLEAKVTKSLHVMEPQRPRSGRLHPRWKVWMNVSEDELRQVLSS